MAGQRTALRFGGVRAEVSLVKMDAKPKDAQHETRRVLAEPRTAEVEIARSQALTDPLGGPQSSEPLADPFGEPQTPGARAFADAPQTETGRIVADTVARHGGPAVDMSQEDVARAARDMDEQSEASRLADRLAPSAVDPDGSLATSATNPDGTLAPSAIDPPAQVYTPPATTVQQGVTLDDGTWIDLTDRLREVDDRTKVDGLEVVATISSTSVPRERVRGAHHVAIADAKQSKVLALLWHALRTTNRAAAVVWTKRTARTLGIIIARGSLDNPQRPAHLVLLELEWAQNMREPGAKVTGPITAKVSRDEIMAAVELVESFEAGPSALDGLRDERLAKRAELLELARSGKLAEYVPPAEPLPEVEASDDLVGALSAAAAALR